ncbi:DUF4157 domain-containing protein [Rhodococcus aetherivorans]|uniref:eCIS core domain-containing protein n=1 Tax=Rhodococcus aetherivorans TaxID=191292 RepID=UPI00366FC620
MLRTPGTPLPEPLRSTMERRFNAVTASAPISPAVASAQRESVVSEPGDADERKAEILAARVTDHTTTRAAPGSERHNFRNVRIHTDEQAAGAARAVHANAYTIGSHIVFGAGQYSPNTTHGRRLIAHELTHTVQQKSTRAPSLLLGASLVSTARYDRWRLLALESSDVVQPGARGEGAKNPPRGTSGGANLRTAGLSLQRQTIPGSVKAPAEQGDVIEFTQGGFELEKELLRRGILKPGDYDSWGFLAEGYYFAQSSGSGPTFRHYRVLDALAIRNDQGAVTGYRIISYLHRFNQANRPSPDEPTGARKKQAAIGATRKPSAPAKPVPASKPDAAEPKAAESADEMQAEFGALPESIKDLLKGGEPLKPENLAQLLRIAAKLKRLQPEDLQLYKILAKKLATDLDAFERSVDAFIQFKSHIEAQADVERKEDATGKEPNLEEKLSRTWGQFDEKKFGVMNTGQKEDLARDIAAEQRNIQLEHMATHPGETAVGMAEGMVRLDRTAKAIAEDVKEAADGSKGAYTRLAGAVGAYNKYVAAAASIVFIALLFVPGVNLIELAAAGLAVAAATIVLSATEAELRIKAAGEAKTPEEFKTQTAKSGAAQAQAVMAAAMLALTLVAKIVARIPLPGRYQNVGSALKVARAALLEKSGIGTAWLSIKTDLLAKLRASRQGLPEALAEQTNRLATTAKAVEGMSGDEFVKHLADGDPKLSDLGIPSDQAKAMQKLAATPEGKNIPEQLRRDSLQALQDAPAEAAKKVDRFLKSVDDSIDKVEKAEKPEQLKSAVDDASKQLGADEQASQAVADEQAFVKKRVEGARRSGIREQAQKKLGALQEERVKTQAEITRLEGELSEANKKVNRLKQKVLDSQANSEARASALKELNEAKEALAELREADELGGYREERTKQNKAEEAILQSLKLKRPSLWQSTKDAIKKAAETNSEGKFLDANTGEVIQGEPVYGHKYGREHRRLALEASEKGMTQEQFTQWVNEHPEWFQTETKANNESHRFEKPGID